MAPARLDHPHGPLASRLGSHTTSQMCAIASIDDPVRPSDPKI